MSLTWTLAEIRAEFRKFTGRGSTGEISDDDVDDLLNNYYVNYFPEDAKVVNFDSFFTQALSATDDGEYPLAQTVVKLMTPMTIDGAEIDFHQDKNYFFELYPEEEQYITSPTLAIGSSDTKKVKNSAFDYQVQRDSYSKTETETAFSGLNTVPQNKYGAFSLKIDKEGDITIAEADDNATGYLSPKLAIQGLATADDDSAYMGVVTVISTDSGGFVPGTTALDNSAVDDTYTDGDPNNRATPEAALYIHNKLFVRPKSDDIHQFSAASELNRPDELSDDDSVPLDKKWGSAIALGTAIIYLAPRGDQQRIFELTGIPNFSLADYQLKSIQTKKRLSMRGRVPEPWY